MKSDKKQKTTAAIGAGSTLLGSIGAAISGLSWCPCVLAPIFSFAGILTIVTSFLSKNKIYFLIIGFILLLVSYNMHGKKKTCAVHKKA